MKRHSLRWAGLVATMAVSLGLAACSSAGKETAKPPPSPAVSVSASASSSPTVTAVPTETPTPPGVPPSHPRPADIVDANCAHTKMSFDDNFWAYWISEGKGAVAFRLYANLDVYDLCNHGGIWGTVAIYDANIKAKNGQVVLGKQYVSYNRSGIAGWQNANVWSIRWTDASGWTWYSVYTDNNVGMSPRTYFDYVKVSAYIVFDNVPGAGRRETCTRSSNTWSCKGHLGL